VSAVMCNLAQAKLLGLCKADIWYPW